MLDDMMAALNRGWPGHNCQSDKHCPFDGFPFSQLTILKTQVLV